MIVASTAHAAHSEPALTAVPAAPFLAGVGEGEGVGLTQVILSDLRVTGKELMKVLSSPS